MEEIRRRKFDAVIASARQFRRTALALLDVAPKETGNGSQPASAVSLGIIVCAATNLAFALELYLKTARLRDRKGPIKSTHKLDEIFHELPVAAQEDVLNRYRVLLEETGSEPIQFIYLSAGSATPPNWPNRVELNDDLVPMLCRSRDVFVNWRYAYELGLEDEGTHKLIRFEHSLMNIACEAVEGHLRGD